MNLTKIFTFYYNKKYTFYYSSKWLTNNMTIFYHFRQIYINI